MTFVQFFGYYIASKMLYAFVLSVIQAINDKNQS